LSLKESAADLKVAAGPCLDRERHLGADGGRDRAAQAAGWRGSPVTLLLRRLDAPCVAKLGREV